MLRVWQHGFSLIELMVTLTILSLLLLIAAPMFLVSGPALVKAVPVAVLVRSGAGEHHTKMRVGRLVGGRVRRVGFVRSRFVQSHRRASLGHANQPAACTAQ
mgnify:CR=1 FL=1